MFLEVRERAAEGETDLTLTLPFEARQRSRLRVCLSSGEEAALLLPRGSILRGGDLLRLSDGRLVRVAAASETVSTVRSRDARSLARVAYHLGNRHVALEVGEGFVRYLHDHVLDDMVRELGLHAEVEQAPFEPEAGAYGRGHAHGQGQRHVHDQVHAHGHGHVNDHVHVLDHVLDHDHDHDHDHGHCRRDGQGEHG